MSAERFGRSVPAARCRALRLAGQQDRDAGQHQHDADHRKGVAEAQHQRLALDGVAERDDRLLARGGRIGTPCARK